MRAYPITAAPADAPTPEEMETLREAAQSPGRAPVQLWRQALVASEGRPDEASNDPLLLGAALLRALMAGEAELAWRVACRLRLPPKPSQWADGLCPLLGMASASHAPASFSELLRGYQIRRREPTAWGRALVKALLAQRRGRNAVAARHYAACIKAVHEAPIYVQALAHERFAAFLAASGLQEAADSQLRHAASLYATWGATWKTAALAHQLGMSSEALEKSLSTTGTTLESSTLDTNTDADMQKVLEASRALSSDIRREAIIQHLLDSAMSASSATVGAILEPNEGGFCVTALAAPGQQWLAPSNAPPWQAVAPLADKLPADLLASGSPEMAPTGKPGELCILQPVIQHGAHLATIALLGMDLSPRETAMAAALATQAGISLENAQLYADLELKVQARTRALEAAQAAVVSLERQATEMQMAGGFAHEMRNAVANARSVTDVLLGGAGDTTLLEQSHLALASIAAATRDASPTERRAVESAVAAAQACLPDIRAAFDAVAAASAATLELTTAVLTHAALDNGVTGAAQATDATAESLDMDGVRGAGTTSASRGRPIDA